MGANLVRYQSSDEDSARWDEFEFRDGDIVISTRSKSGTTWMQMICALLVFESPDFPVPLHQLSPWLDWLGSPIETVIETLQSQEHRRIIKTHTPLDGLPTTDKATFIVVGRHPLDVAISLYHQGNNLDRDRMAELIGQQQAGQQQAEQQQTVPPERPQFDDWFQDWMGVGKADPRRLDSLPGICAHLSAAWERSRQDENVVLVHYADLSWDLPAEMARLARVLRFDLGPSEIERLAPEATFETMRNRSAALAPNPGGILKDTNAFFRAGPSVGFERQLTKSQITAYYERAGALMDTDLNRWLHRDSRVLGHARTPEG